MASESASVDFPSPGKALVISTLLGALRLRREHQIAPQVAYALIEKAALQAAPATACNAHAVRTKCEPKLHIRHLGQGADDGHAERLLHAPRVLSRSRLSVPSRSHTRHSKDKKGHGKANNQAANWERPAWRRDGRNLPAG